MIFFPIIFPLAAAVVLLALSKYLPSVGKFLGFAGASLAFVGVITLCNFLFSPIAHRLFQGILPDTFSLLIALCIAFFGFMAAIAALRFKDADNMFHFNLLISLGFALGAVLADNFLVMLLFWEGLLISLYLFIAKKNLQTAVKAFLINAAGDVLLLAGVVMLYAKTASLTFSDAVLVDLGGSNLWVFILLFTGTVAKAGAFPFQSWIMLAAKDMNSVFMALLPASIEKLLAVFLLGKLFTVTFPLVTTNAALFMLGIATVTIILAGMQMLGFKSLKQLLALNVVMQIGLLIMSLAVHELMSPQEDLIFIANHGIFKASLLAAAFFAAANIELRNNSTLLADMQGLSKYMPLTKWVLLLCMLGLAGTAFVDIFAIPNALLADTWATFPLFIPLPLFAAFVTLFSFTKVFKAMGTPKEVQLAPKSKLLNFVMLVCAAVALFFFIGFEVCPCARIIPHFAGFNFNFTSATVIIILIVSIILGLSLKQPNFKFEDNTFNIAKNSIFKLAGWLFKIDRGMDFLLDRAPSVTVHKVSAYISGKHTGSMPRYMLWAIMGIIAFIILIVLGGIK